MHILIIPNVLEVPSGIFDLGTACLPRTKAHIMAIVLGNELQMDDYAFTLVLFVRLRSGVLGSECQAGLFLLSI